ncbi:MAG: hypothetical protein R3Y57_02380 [Erysipelotrichaceae bacterium]
MQNHINDKNTVETRGSINKLQKELDVMKEVVIELIEEFCKIDTDEIIEQHDVLLVM